ncbi:unnamed protein product [Paramecium sonneborni]|uniref:RBR-type E3 ubiquitin transferase n=1 Tax=Paramecium sonneborni TaxID=65129 RepID=A0A8S1RD13_9CILI|nr:unnamed protein product [Paramecium sonneborni]
MDYYGEDYDTNDCYSYPSKSQETLELQDFMEYIDQLINNIGELLNFDSDNTYEILMFYNWNKDRIESEYHEKIIEQLQKQGILNNHSAISYENNITSCPLCLEITTMVKLGCGHLFCHSCVTHTIAQRFSKEQFLVVPCLQYGCKYRLPISMIKKFSRLEDFKKIICKKFIDTNKSIAYCLGVDCKKILRPKDLSITTVTCSCGTSFCFRCKNELHLPVPCDMAKKWVSEINKNETNILWIVLNTKICPFCKKPVERSDGCNYLMCKPPGGCGNAFCYVCSNPWEPDHKDHFICSKYVPPTNNLFSFAKLNFSFEKFLYSQIDVEQNQNRLKQFKQKLKTLEFSKFTALEATFLETSLQELIQSRQVLKWTYCLDYFISQNNSNSYKLFNNYLQDFEDSCEQLSQVCMQLLDEFEQMQYQFQYMTQEEKRDVFLKIEQFQKVLNKCKLLRINLLKASENDDIIK